MKTISLKNKIEFHPNTNGGRTLKEAYKLIQDKETLFTGITLFRGLGLNAEMLNHKSIKIFEFNNFKGGLSTPLIKAEIS